MGQRACIVWGLPRGAGMGLRQEWTVVARAGHPKCQKGGILLDRVVARNPSHRTGVIGKYAPITCWPFVWQSGVVQLGVHLNATNTGKSGGNFLIGAYWAVSCHSSQHAPKHSK